MLHNKQQKVEQKSKKEIEKLRGDESKKEQAMQRKYEKIFSQVLQLNSAAIHLKDLLTIVEVDTQGKNQVSDLADYVENNFQNTLYKVMKMLSPSTPLP